MELPAREEREPAQQTVGKPTVHSVSMKMTPVYGTTVPPRGVSGAMRTMAYKIPEHKPAHWLMLLMADRVDVMEGWIGDLARPRTLLIGGGVLGLGVLGWMLARRR
jgi:hypothetical protein